MTIFGFTLNIFRSADISGIRELDRQMQKFRELRDSYYETNREYYGEYFATLMDGRR